MRRVLFPVFAASVIFGCAYAKSDAVRGEAVFSSVGAGPALVVPQSLLRRVSQINVDVAPAADDVRCDPSTGQIVGGARPGQYLASTNCNDGSPYCLDIDLGPTPLNYVLAARGTEASGELYAVACGELDIKKDKAVSLVLRRAGLNASCGDRVLQLGEQCEDPGTRPLSCAANCTSTSLALATTGASGNSLAATSWPLGNATLFVGFTNAAGAACGAQLNADFERQNLDAPFASGQACVSVPSGSTAAQIQRTASGFRTLYLNNGTRLSTALYSPALLASDVGQPVSGTAGGPDGAFTAAVSADVTFVAWINGSGGLSGRSISTGALGPQRLYADTGDVLAPRIVAWRDGWILVWESAGAIRLRLLSADGTPRGTDVRVNAPTVTAASTKPDVAALADGRFAIVWESGGEVWGQRFSAAGAAEPNNQLAPLHDARGGSARGLARVVGGQGQVPFFAVAWSRENGAVEARLLSPTGSYLLNAVDGTDSEFLVARNEGGAMRMPALAVGGSAPTLGVFWGQAEGFFARRFPTPTR